MPGDGFDVRPEALGGVSSAIRDDAERVRLVGTVAANALLAAAAASGTGPLAGALDQLRDDLARTLAATSAEIAANADRLVAAASRYQASDASASEAIRRALSPDASTRP